MINYEKELLKELKPLIDKLLKVCSSKKPLSFTLPFMIRGGFAIKPFEDAIVGGTLAILKKDQLTNLILGDRSFDLLGEDEIDLLSKQNDVVKSVISETRKVEDEIVSAIKEFGKRHGLSRTGLGGLRSEIDYEIESRFSNKHGGGW